MRGIICEDIGGPDHRCIPIGSRQQHPGCDPRCNDHAQPTGYIDAGEWAEYMLQTHDQAQCPGCGLWTIWTRREEATDDRG